MRQSQAWFGRLPWFIPTFRRNLQGHPPVAPWVGAFLLASMTLAPWGSTAAQTTEQTEEESKAKPKAESAREPDAEPKVQFPPLVVTGNSLRRSPLAVTTVTGKSLVDRGIVSATELRYAVPNLSQNNAGLRSFSDNYAIRGIGNTEFLSDPAVVLYVDGAPFGDNTTYTTDLLAIERVDVYRGPQGSRFGKNAAAGVIDIITRQPGERLEPQGSISGGTFNTWEYRASALGSVVKDKAFFAAAGQYASGDGFIRNDFLNSHADEREAFNGRASLDWRPQKSWDARLVVTMDRFRDGLGIVSLAGDPRVTMSDVNGRIDSDANSQSVRVRGTLPTVELASVTTRRDFTLDPFLLDPDFSPFPGNTAVVTYRQPQWTEELQLSPISPGDRWKWNAGLFFSTDETKITRTADFFVPPSGSGNDVNRSTEHAETYAFLGTCSRRANDQLNITVGLRLDYSVRDLERTRTSSFGTVPPVDVHKGFFNAAPKLTLDFHPSDRVLLYASTGLGFKPGGFSAFIDPPASPEFDTETTWANEVGLKSTPLGDNLTANLAFFYYGVNDYQVEQQTPGGVEFTVVNAPEARSIGGELELTAHRAAWDLSAFLGYTDARLDRYTDPFSGVSVHDTHAPFIAEFNGGVAVQYRHGSGLFGRLEGLVFGDTYYEATNAAAFRQSAYGLLRARAGLERGHLGVSVFGDNLSDTEYFTKKIPPLNAGAPGRPRTFGLLVSAR